MKHNKSPASGFFCWVSTKCQRLNVAMSRFGHSFATFLALAVGSKSGLDQGSNGFSSFRFRHLKAILCQPYQIVLMKAAMLPIILMGIIPLRILPRPHGRGFLTPVSIIVLAVILPVTDQAPSLRLSPGEYDGFQAAGAPYAL